MNDFIHGPQLSHPPDGPGGLLSQDKPHNHGMNDSVSGTGSPVHGRLLFQHLLPRNYLPGSAK